MSISNSHEVIRIYKNNTLVKGRDTYRRNQKMSKNVSELSETDKSRDIIDSEEPIEYNIPESQHEQPKNNVKQPDRNKTPTNIQNNNSTTSTNDFAVNGFLCIVFGLIFAICALQYRNTPQDKSTHIDSLKQIFPNQPNETFENFEAVIDDILYSKEIHPAVFLLLYDRNESKANTLVHHLANYASHKLQTNTDYIDVHKNEFHTGEALNDYGYLLDKYKLDLLDKKVMVVKNIQNIPAHVAQVFHSFCDEISPLVEKVVYIFTLQVDSMVGKEEKIAESNLKRFWNNLDNDILMPLITRVTSTVLKISN